VASKSKVSWEYLAGFFDGEGWITSDCGYGSKYFVIGMCQLESKDRVLKEIIRFLKTKEIFCQQYFRPRTKVSQLRIRGDENMMKFLEGVLPYLIVKEAHAKAAMKYLKQTIPARAKYGNAWRRNTDISFPVFGKA
jgi:hypothetical protein